MDKAKYQLDLGDERLWNGNQPVQITNKAFQLLRLFVRKPNQMLTKDNILEGVWGDVCVSEGLIKEYVHDLRVALGDDPRNPDFIETVHGRGYRFLGGVEEINGADGPVTQETSRSYPPSLVVLPFANLTGEERWARFCYGLGDDLVTDLARYPELRIVASSLPSALPADRLDAREIRRELAIDYVLSGSVQASASKVRINVKLIEARSGTHVWTEQYERDLGEFFTIQSDVIAHVASALGGFSGQIPHAERQRLGRKLPSDLHAYEIYLLGYQLETRFEKESALPAFELLQRATALEPDFARAWLVLGWICWQIAMENWAEDAQKYRELKHEAFRTAARLDPLDSFAQMELSAVRAIDGDTTGASDALERALDLGRNQADLLIAASNYVATVMDDPARAVQVLNQGLPLPAYVSEYHYLTVTRVAYFAEDFEGSVEAAKRGPDALPARLFELLSLAQLGRMDEAGNRAQSFSAVHPAFDPPKYMEDHPITAEGAKRLFLDGIEKAGLH